MKFSTQSNPQRHTSVFSLEMAEDDFRSRFLTPTLNLIMNYLARMVAAHYYKHHRAEWQAFIESEDVKNRIATILAERILLDLKE